VQCAAEHPWVPQRHMVYVIEGTAYVLMQAVTVPCKVLPSTDVMDEGGYRCRLLMVWNFHYHVGGSTAAQDRS